MIARVMEKTGATVWAWGLIYKAAEQLVLLYGSGRCVVTGDILKVLKGFHHRAVRRITGMTETRGAGRDWEYPPVAAAMKAVRLHPIEEYIGRWQENIAEKVACRPIYEICVDAKRIPGTS